MDRTDPVPSPAVSAEAAQPATHGSQSKVPAVLYWVLAAAFLFRVATGILDRGGKETAAVGLVRWQPGAAAMSAAAQSRRLVLYDFTAAWCAPCHLLDSEGWSDSTIAAVVNESFVAARVVDRTREDGTNPHWIEELQQRYSVTAFPTLIVADASGRELSKMEGYMGKARLITFLQEAKRKAGK